MVCWWFGAMFTEGGPAIDSRRAHLQVYILLKEEIIKVSGQIQGGLESVSVYEALTDCRSRR